jgi:hypothetical protein
MITIFLIIFLSSLWGIVISEDLLGIPANIKSDYLLIDVLIKLLRCPMCLSYHISWVSWLVILGNFWGILICIVTYWLTYLIKKFTDISI